MWHITFVMVGLGVACGCMLCVRVEGCCNIPEPGRITKVVCYMLWRSV